MIKGAQKRMIVMKTADSKIFEEAYFVLRKQSENMSHADIVDEANRIIETCDGKKGKRQTLIKERLGRAALFIGSGAVGGGIVGLIALVI